MIDAFSQLFSDPVMTMWFLVSAGFGFLALFALRVWLDIKGIRGLAMVTLALSCALLSMLLGVAHSPTARIPWPLILIGLRPLFLLILLSVGVIIDLWAADHNDHRSLTTITYQWFKRLTKEQDHRREQAIRMDTPGEQNVR